VEFSSLLKSISSKSAFASTTFKMANVSGGTHILSGEESQRLRNYCTSESYSAADLDNYARLLHEPAEKIRANFEDRVKATDIDKARQALADIQYGPTKVPLFNYILQLTILNPPQRVRCIETARYLALGAKVPVDTTDLSGTTAFMYSISTKPYWDREFADIMLEASAAVNHRNRYGGVAGHDIVMARDVSPAGKMKTLEALKYFVEKGGDVNIADGDGVTVKRIGTSVDRMIQGIGAIINGGTGAEGLNNLASAVGGGKKIGRNDPCHCSSKKKFKVCCGKV